jgi:2-dehydro-3-deoxygalactonokinase
MSVAGRVALIAVDWGSTRLRVSAVGADGAVHRHETTDQGILGLGRVRQGETLRGALAPMCAAYPDVPVVAAGMIGSRNGMVETVPVALPATVADVAAGMATLVLDDLTTVRISPGLTDRSADPVDLIRGEEVQVLGYLADHPGESDAVLVLPGTHSKWVTVHRGAIVGFRTFLTGELYAQLRGTPSLRPTVDRGADPAGFDWFGAGLRLADLDGGLLRQLFAARSRMLASRLGADEMAELLSGLVIATEIAGARQAGLLVADRAPVVIADPALAQHYRQAFAAAGIDVAIAQGDVFGRGIAAIAARLAAADIPSMPRDRSSAARSRKESHHG